MFLAYRLCTMLEVYFSTIAFKIEPFKTNLRLKLGLSRDAKRDCAEF